MDNQIRWLLAEIEHWTTDGLVSAEQADQLRQRYAQPAVAAKEGGSWGLIVFTSAGAVVIGLGVILLFAYNWDDIPKFGKLALILGATIGAHWAGLRCRERDDWRKPLGAVLHLLGTMMYGAGIWLIAQIYNINEHFPNGFLLWALGALLLAWVLDSIVQGLLATVLLAIWGGSELYSFREPQMLSLLLIVFGVGPLAWRRRSGVLLCFVLLAVQFLLMSYLGLLGTGAHVFTTAFALGAFWIALARLTTDTMGFPSGVAVMSFMGYTGYILCSYLISFRWLNSAVFNWDRAAAQPTYATAMLCNWSVFALAIAAWLIVVVRTISRRVLRPPVEEWLVPLALAYCFAIIWGRYPALTPLGTRPFNLFLLGLAAAWMWRGSRTGALRQTVLGLVLLSAVVLARYFDLFQSLAARGLAFVVLGVVLLSVVFLRRRARSAPPPQGGAA